MRAKKMEWPVIFWKIFATLVDFECTECHQQFPGNKLNHCSFHLSKAFFGYNQN